MQHRMLAFAALGILFVAVAYLAAGLPTADFYVNFYEAGRAVIHGRSPYDAPAFSSAPWGVVPVVPFALLPPVPAHGLYFAASMFVLAYVAWRLKATPWTIAAMLLSPTAIGALLVGNLDPFVISGILFPPILGLLILLTKPQIGAGVALYYLIDFARTKRVLEGMKIFAPTVAALGLALWLFPAWHTRALDLPANPWNRSLFPFSVPLGLLLLWLALRNRNPYFALAAGPFLTPYLTFYSYLAAQIGLLHVDVEKAIRRDVLQVILSAFLWIIMLRLRL